MHARRVTTETRPCAQATCCPLFLEKEAVAMACQFYDCPSRFTGVTTPCLKCARCKLVGYCSKTCQKADWIVHKEVCHVALDQRHHGALRAISNHTQRGDGFDSICLSGVTKVTINDVAHTISVFAGLHRFAYRCAVCEGSMGSFLQGLIAFRYKDRGVHYFRCEDCLSRRRRLCEVTMKECTPCVSALAKKLPLIRCMQESLTKDVVDIILCFFASPLHNCHHIYLMGAAGPRENPKMNVLLSDAGMGTLCDHRRAQRPYCL